MPSKISAVLSKLFAHKPSSPKEDKLETTLPRRSSATIGPMAQENNAQNKYTHKPNYEAR
ncbi:hypothetical protein GGF44_005365, partial [Coemansia sp. RSA 1694]